MNACVKTGATVHILPYDLVFQADLFEIAGAMVVRANGPLVRGHNCWESSVDIFKPTHELLDDHGTGFWRDDLGVFVVRKDLVREL